MCNEDRYFIDSHCHLFSESDISILEIFERASRSAAGLLPITIINGYLDWKSPQFKKFFKTTTEKNIIEIIDKINGIKNPDLSCRKKILVPLMLDMEISEPYHPLKYQVNRLKDAITSFDEKYAENDVKILPFIGLDMERFNCDSSPEDVIKEVLDRSDLSFFMGEDRKAHNNLRNGDIIGIKLYPSLGFNPCPAAGEVKDKYMNAYKYFAQNEIPITIHCQKDSLLAGEKEKDELESYNDPRCWIEMLNAEKDLENIRINFAHFGGDTDVAQTIRFQKRSSDGSDDLFSDDINYHYVMDPFRDSMTYSIIKLVKKYKNIYTDISALNYKIVDTGLALAWIFAFDAAGKFDAACKSDAEEEYKLMDKILWGSDYPMPLRTLDSYGEIFSEFRKWFRFRNYKYRYDEPGTNPDYRDGLPDPDELLENLIDRNPKKFLFG